MKIAVISDTHIKKKIEVFKEILEGHLKDFDLIIHGGDYNHMEVLKLLQETGKFVGVWGNADSDEIKETLKEKEVLEVEGLRIGIFHGHGEKKTTIERAVEALQQEHVDIIIFGHSHQPLIQSKKGILLLNPGSITSKRRERWFSFISLELADGEINAELKLIPQKQE